MEQHKQQPDHNHPPPRRGKPPEAAHHQPPPPQKCPRCDSSNTKFCYYNNYSLSQPRYFCKGCRRYWTQGGTLRNVPVGGGCRKSKRPKQAVSTSSGEIVRSQLMTAPALPAQSMMRAAPAVMPSIGNSFYSGGSFLSTLATMQSNLGGNAQYDANLGFLQGVNLRPQAAAAAVAPPQNHEYLTIPAARPVGSWTQSFMNRGVAASSSAGFWGGAAGDGENQAAGSSFNPGHWGDNNHHPGFDPAQ